MHNSPIGPQSCHVILTCVPCFSPERRSTPGRSAAHTGDDGIISPVTPSTLNQRLTAASLSAPDVTVRPASGGRPARPARCPSLCTASSRSRRPPAGTPRAPETPTLGPRSAPSESQRLKATALRQRPTLFASGAIDSGRFIQTALFLGVRFSNNGVCLLFFLLA